LPKAGKHVGSLSMALSKFIRGRNPLVGDDKKIHIKSGCGKISSGLMSGVAVKTALEPGGALEQP